MNTRIKSRLAEGAGWSVTRGKGRDSEIERAREEEGGEGVKCEEEKTGAVYRGGPLVFSR